MKKNQGMALPIVLMFIFAVFAIVFYIAAVHKQDKTAHIVAREHYRAIYLAKGAVQLALLKARMVPQEFRDACTFWDGHGTIENMSHNFGNLEKHQDVLGQRDSESPVAAWKVEGEFIRELQMMMTPGASPSWSHEKGLVVDGPFTGEFVITDLKMLTRRIGVRNDTIKVIARAREISEMTVGQAIGGVDKGTGLNLGQKLEEIHEIILK
ncbi:MAG: hypothetical protein PHQ23_04965 [Candidatus Wallbacteria bacterium]|nr:hypothetical protein [Candidatus Wallbacteria bacterium]